MKRAFDLAPIVFAKLMKDIKDGQDTKNMQLQFDIDEIRGMFLSRRPQIMITNNDASMIKVVKAKVSLPRPDVCPVEESWVCKNLTGLDIDEFINSKDDDIKKYAN